MLVRQIMTKKPITIRTDISVSDALDLMHEKKVHRLPVLDTKGRLVGIVAEGDLLYASPSPATSLNVWEIHSLLAKLKVDKVMTRKLIIVADDTTVEEAAQIMVEKKIGGLPVVCEKKLVGIVTETDLFKVFISMLGGHRQGVRVTASIPGVKGTFAKIATAIFKNGGDIVGLGFNDVSDVPQEDWEMVIKVQGITKANLVTVLKPLVKKIKDARKM
jgi:acetoin utilization protein AcuB